MDRHFDCTACGRCCYGWLPLTVTDALAHAGRFPLAVVWTPVKQGSKAFDMTARLGLALRLHDRRRLAVRIAPTAYLPPSFPCPALTPENLCAIHAEKPLRCRTMPFFPYREESDQADLLIPRPGWSCDTSPAARAVYRDRTVLEREDFDRERTVLLQQAPILRAYAEWIMKIVPGMEANLTRAAQKPGGGHVIVGFASLLRRLNDIDRSAVALAQRPLLAAFAEKVAGQPALAEYHRNYGDWGWEMERLTG